MEFLILSFVLGDRCSIPLILSSENHSFWIVFTWKMLIDTFYFLHLDLSLIYVIVTELSWSRFSPYLTTAFQTRRNCKFITQKLSLLASLWSSFHSLIFTITMGAYLISSTRIYEIMPKKLINLTIRLIKSVCQYRCIWNKENKNKVVQ